MPPLFSSLVWAALLLPGFMASRTPGVSPLNPPAAKTTHDAGSIDPSPAERATKEWVLKNHPEGQKLGGPAPNYHPSRILVGTFGVNLTEAVTAIESLNLTFKALCQDAEVGILNITDGAEPKQKIALLDSLGLFPYAEPDYRVHFNTPRASEGIDLVSDRLHLSLWPYQYGPRVTRADKAWERGAQGEGVIVAILDTGVDLNHPDLQSSLWTNEAELNGLPGVDDDGNGYIDDIHGWNWASNNGTLKTGANPHGTHVAGIIAASHEETVGIKGIAPKARIMVLEFLEEDGTAYLSQGLAAIEYGVVNGAGVFSHSWGSDVHKDDPTAQSMKDALRSSASKGILHIASAGNAATNLDDLAATTNLPCTYDLPNVVCVAATNEKDELAKYSNYGEMSVDIAAPGDAILSLASNGVYGFMSGTSMAAPHVAGVCALIMSEAMARNKTTDLGAFTKEVLLYSADRVPGLEGKVARGGARVNALNSMLAVQEGIMPPYPDVAPTAWRDYHSPLNMVVISTWEMLQDVAGVLFPSSK